MLSWWVADHCPHFLDIGDGSYVISSMAVRDCYERPEISPGLEGSPMANEDNEEKSNDVSENRKRGEKEGGN